MNVTYRTPNDRITFQFEAATEKAAFEQLGHLQELFEEAGCGCCGSVNIRHDVRMVEDNKFYHLVCRDCRARLDFGQTKKGEHLFAKRKDETKKPLPNAGWYKWAPEAAEARHPDPVLEALTSAGDKRALKAVGERIKADVAAGRIGPDQAAGYRAAYERRDAELSGRGGRAA